MRPIQFIILACFLLGSGEISVPANPAGGNVAAGSATIQTVPGTVSINQASNTAIINWQSFSINSGELTKFIQPSGTSAALNRVLGGQSSIINGTLSANGQLYLINGNGILVGPGGVVNANSFTASTRDISDADFLSGNLHFVGNSDAGVQNLGTIKALGGDVYLIGKTVDNQGTIKAKGTVGLASGDDVVLNLAGDEHVFVNPSAGATAAADKTAVHNSGTIAAATAELKAANGNLFALAINNEGTIRATSVSQQGGRIFLTTDAGSVQNSGTLRAKAGHNGGQVKITGGSVWNSGIVDASGSKGGAVAINSQNFQNDGLISVKGTAGAGGAVTATVAGNALAGTTGTIDASGVTQGGSIQITGEGASSMAYLSLKLDASSTQGAGGTIDIDSPTVYLTGANLTVSGATQGGNIFLGESDPGSSVALPEAQTVYVSTGTSLSADATGAGNGGQISAHSSGNTEFLGSAEARGNGAGGNGGQIEVSGSGSTYFGGQADASAPQGVAGTFLLDPKYILVGGSSSAAFEFVDPDPGPNNDFGQLGGILNLSTNNTVITSPGDAFGGTAAGAVYLFSDTNGALISTLRGSHANDAVGSSVANYSTGYLVSTPTWNNTAGAITYGNGTTGISGNVSASNSLVGSVSGDRVGSGAHYTFGPNVLILSPNWSSGAGAATFVAGTAFPTGVLSASNSLVGTSAGDGVGSAGVTSLNSGNYLVLSPTWNSNTGAVTFGSGTAGVTGTIGAGNSLIGAMTNDQVGTGIDQLDNGSDYLVLSPHWHNGDGAITMGSETTGVSGVVSASNSLVGSLTTDNVGAPGTINDEGDYYLVLTSNWGNGAGAVTWNDESAGTTGPISAVNSLVGSSTSDRVGAATTGTSASTGTITYVYDSGSGTYNYLIDTPRWNGNTGAVTFGSGSGGVSGTINASNSLIGQATGDQIGSSGIVSIGYAESYLVLSPHWSNGRGAITMGSSTGVTGTVSGSNSLVGSLTTDGVGATGSVLDENNYYLVVDSAWGGGEGSVTWNSEGSGKTGTISASNSLVGTNTNDGVGSGGVTIVDYEGTLNYLVVSPKWNGNAGAVTFGSAFSGVSGTVSSSNSLIGQSPGDQIGSGNIVTLNDGNEYLVLSPLWSNGRGAITMGSTNSGVTGTVSGSNSLVGSLTSDGVGTPGSIQDETSYYLVVNPYWGGGEGAVTYNNEDSGTIGPISASNSLVGSSTTDMVSSGGIVYLPTDDAYLVLSPDWNGNEGAVTWGADPGVSGTISASNSLIGSTSGDYVGEPNSVTVLPNDDYLVTTSTWNSSTGAVTWGDGTIGVSGTISTANSLVGAASGDEIGSAGIYLLGNRTNYLVLSPSWGMQAGAITNGSDSTGITGIVSASNSLVGALTTDNVGDGSIYDYTSSSYSPSQYYLVSTDNWGGGAGAVTWNPQGGTVGVVSSANSLVGSNSSDDIGAYGIDRLDNGDYVVISPFWNNDRGAVTWGSAGGISGVVSSSNSLVGSVSGDMVGNGFIEYLPNGNYVVNSPNFNNSAGAATWGSEATGISGVVNSSNSIIGGSSNDGERYIGTSSNGSIFVVAFTSDTSAGGHGRVYGESVNGPGATSSYSSSDPNSLTYTDDPSATVTINPSSITAITDNGTSVVLQANTDITVNQAIQTVAPSGTGGNLTLDAGRSILLNANITTDDGNLTLVANDPNANATYRDAGAGNIVQTNSTINTGSGQFTATVGQGVSPGSVTLDAIDASSVFVSALAPFSDITLNGPIQATRTRLNAGFAFINNAGPDAITGQYTIFSFSPFVDRFGGLTGQSIFGATPDTMPDGTGNFFLFGGFGLQDQELFNTFSVSGFTRFSLLPPFYIFDPDTLAVEPFSVGVESGGAINHGKGRNLASGSSTANAAGPKRLVTPGNGIWYMLGGIVHSGTPPPFVMEQLKLNLSPAIYGKLDRFLFVNP